MRLELGLGLGFKLGLGIPHGFGPMPRSSGGGRALRAATGRTRIAVSEPAAARAEVDALRLPHTTAPRVDEVDA